MAKVIDTATPGFEQWDKDVRKELKKIMSTQNSRAVKTIKRKQLSNASFFWRNRTRKAARNISGEVEINKNSYDSAVGHGSNVPYAFFLEVENQGKYAMLPSALKYLAYITTTAIKKLGFATSFTLEPYRPTASDRTAAQRKKK